MPTIITPSHQVTSPTHMAQGGDTGTFGTAGSAFAYAQIIAALAKGGGSRQNANTALAAINLLPGGGIFNAGVRIAKMARRGKKREAFTLPGVDTRGDKDPILKSFALGVPSATLRKRRDIPRAAERAQAPFDFAIGETRRRLSGLELDEELNGFNIALASIKRNYVGTKSYGGLQAQFDLLTGAQEIITASGRATPEFDRQSIVRAFDYNKRDLARHVANVQQMNDPLYNVFEMEGPSRELFPEHFGKSVNNRLKGFQQAYYPTLNPFPNAGAQNVRAEFIAQGKPVPADVQRDSDTINRLLGRFDNLRVARDVYYQDGGQLGMLGLKPGDTSAFDIVNPPGELETQLRTPFDPTAAEKSAAARKSVSGGSVISSQQARGRRGVSGAANISRARVLV